MMLNVFLNLAPGDLAKCTDLAQLQSELKLARRRRRRELPQGTARVPVDGQGASGQTRWEFLEREPHDWKPVELEASKAIERAHGAGRPHCKVSIHQYTYLIDFKTLTQRNLRTGKERHLRRRSAPTIAQLQWELLDERLQSDQAREELEACQKRLAEMEAELAKERRARQEKEGELAEAEKSHKRQKLEADAYSRRLEVELADERQARNQKEEELLEAEMSHKRHKLEADANSRRLLSPLPSYSTLAGSFRDCDQVELPSDDPKHSALCGLLRGSMASHREHFASPIWSEAPDVQVSRIEEVVNPAKLRAYKAARGGEVMNRNPVGCIEIPNIEAFKCEAEPRCVDLNEYLLFHACPLDSVSAICRRGLDPQRGGETAGAMFGRGAYFAQNASKSDFYTTCKECSVDASFRDCNHAMGERCVLVVRVLLGSTFSVTDQDVRSESIRAPERENNEPYDSITVQARANRGKLDHMEFVTFDKQLSLVQYVIWYRHTQSCRCHNCKRRRR
ncbi:Parp11 [Symbiodinium natans]|uniref:Poly [ADP-ribose] polymerase n=1 Tax=Symbiodinium natans TaxID=878477 RepID=A0A812L8H2_9DINO|nr:Parp11 [Symbiodinium natans]